ncbi:aminotransferase [Agaricicola taiwanensis]|uniref:aspartate transaminase n=1 Tax=Agaricicola taiwanensis TaxID=591372 RepID=A0A8J2YHG3_9RHOB|nr:aminotransferase [Agaricicola taiwanensis]GGE42853.1 aminotransferase [Agaricicola taiwanensis]
MNRLFSSLPTTVFETMSALARETGAVNLGQGFPDDPGPEDVRRAAADAVLNGYNQYPSMLGIPELREGIAAHYAHHHSVTLDPAREVMVTSGATEALAGALFALIEPGDEVVLFQPMYDAYLPLVLRAGGVPKFVTLEPPHWRFTEEALSAAFSDKTRVAIINNPLNPSASVFAREDLALLARFAERSNAVVVSDEVWEHVVFDGARHVSVLNIPGLRDRAVKIGSAGKIFSLTGWKVGFVCAAPDILAALARSHQFLTFTTPPNLQVAVAYGLTKDDRYFREMRDDLQAKRDYLSRGLAEAGFTVLPSAGTYFLNVDIAPLDETDDVAFAQKLVHQAGVVTIPVSAFYAQDHVRTVLRFCFAKRRETLDGALEKLAAFLAKV